MIASFFNSYKKAYKQFYLFKNMSLLESIIDDAYYLTRQPLNLWKEVAARDIYKKDEARESVIIIPGFMVTPAMLREISERIYQEGMRPKPWLYYWFRSIDKTVDLIEKKIRNHYVRFRIIGYSEGGLIARDLLTRMPDKISSAVLFGTPNQGTIIAGLAYFLPCARDMFPGSRYLQDLNARKLPHVPITNIITQDDELVQPWQHGCLEGAQNYVVKGVGHLGVTHEYELMVEGLKQGIKCNF